MNPFNFIGQKWTPLRDDPAVIAVEKSSKRRPEDSRILRAIVIILLGLGAMLLCSNCTAQPGTVPKHVPIPAPPVAKRVDLSPLQRSTTEASRSNARASGSVGRIAAELSGLKLDLKATVAEADRLRKQKAASERELELLWQSLTDISGRHETLAKEAETAKGALANQTVTLRNVEDHLAMVQRDAEAKEVEASILRANLSTAEKLRASTGDALQEANASAASHAESANKAKGEMRLYRTIAAIVIGLAVLWAVVTYIRKSSLP